MAGRNDANLIIKNAVIFSKNFEGKEKINPKTGRVANNEGERNFCVVLDPDIAEKLRRDGWNVKEFNRRDPNDEPGYFVQVKVEFSKFPPKIWLVNSEGKRLLRERGVESLDWADLEKIDIEIRPRFWQDDSGKTHVKAYLHSGYFTIEESELDREYKYSKDLDAEDDDDCPFDV